MPRSRGVLTSAEANNPYTIEWTRFDSGERLPLLVRRETGLPIEAPTYWISASERPLNKAAATHEKRLRHLMPLYLWMDARGRTLEELICSPCFLSLEQLNDLDRFCRQRLPEAVAAVRRTQGVRGNLLPVRSRNPRTSPAPSTRAEVGNRLAAIHAFLDHVSFSHASRMEADGAARRVYEEGRKAILRILQERAGASGPAGSSREPREGLEEDKRELLLAVIRPDHADNPWEPPARKRNELLVQMLYDLGIRRGEALCLRVSDITLTPNGGLLRIVRRPQDPEDPRQPKPQVKTLGRELPLGPTLRRMVADYLTERRKLPAARRHPFLFVSTADGAPLSVWSMTKIFLALRERVRDLPEALASHSLRHDWNNRFSEMSDKASPNRDQVAATKEERARAYAQGWSNPATAARYTKRWTKEAASKRSLEMQGRRDILVERTDEKRETPDRWTEAEREG